MSAFIAEQAKPYWPVSNGDRAGDVQAARGVYTISAALAANDTIDLCILPARHVIVDAILDTDSLDIGTGITLNVGTSTTANLLMSASTVARAGGIARMDQLGGVHLAASDADTTLRVTVAAAPTTGRTTGTIGLTVFYRPA